MGSNFPFIELRAPGYALLSGRGIEIGAFEHPAALSSACRVEYCDAITPEEAKRLFPELAQVPLPEINHILDLNKGGLAKFADGSLDFIIFNHVVEHLVNPVKVVGELVRKLKLGGSIAIAAPDKRFTFDKNRPLTPWEHVNSDFESDIEDASPEEYRDILTYIHPELLESPPEQIAAHLERLKSRREHLHVWDSAAFRQFLVRTFELHGASLRPLYEVDGNTNSFEYFGVWQKTERPEAAVPATGLKAERRAWIVERVNHYHREGGIPAIFKAAGRKIARTFKSPNNQT